MRVTNSMMVNNMSYWVAQQAEKLNDAQTAVGSGKKINKPSDDPRAAGQIQSDRVSLSQYSQYESNIAQAKTWVGVSSATLDTVYTTLQNARNTVYSSGGTDIETVVTPTEATSSISPIINLNSSAAADPTSTFSATINIYDADLNEIPLKITFTKTAANQWTWATSSTAGTTVDTATLTFNSDGSLQNGNNPTINITNLTSGADDISLTWDIYSNPPAPGPTNGDITQYAAQSAISTDTTNIAVGLLTNSYNEVLSLANSLYASSYMYAGDLSTTKPFANEVNITTVGGVPENIIFDLAADATSVDIQVSNSAGEVVRHITSVNRTAGTNSISWDGHDDAGIDLSKGQYSYTVTALDGTTAVAAYHTYRGDELNGEKEVLTGVNERLVLNSNGGDIFSDILNKISQALTAITAIGRIRATVPLDEDALAVEEAKWASAGAALKQSLTELETKQVALANASVQLGSASARAQQVTNTTITRISDLELGSPEEAAIKLQAQQTNYEQVISVTANILRMPKLTDYI